MTPSERQAIRRRDARARGLCGQCCKRPTKDGKFRCETCLPTSADPHTCSNCHQDGHNRRTCPMLVERVDDYCIDCQAAGFHRADCPTRKERAA